MRILIYSGYKNKLLNLFLLFVLAAASPLFASVEHRLACHYFDKNQARENSSLVHSGLPWLWAEGENGEAIYVSGIIRDGFMEVEQISGTSMTLLGYKNVSTYENSFKVAHSFCKRALETAFPDKYQQKEVLGLMIKTSFLSLEKVPVVFKNQGSSAHQSVNKIVIFGDSSSDQGKVKQWLKVVPNRDYFGGRFSNGRNWLDYFQQNTDISILNLAVGGSVTHKDNSWDDGQCTMRERLMHYSCSMISGSVDDQIQSYRNDYLNNASVEDSERTLFAILIGGNDYLSYLNSPRKITAFIDEPEHEDFGSNVISRKVVANIEAHMKMLKELGAKHIMVGNLPDLGAVPRIFNWEEIHQGSFESKEEHAIKISKRLTETSKYHNFLLKEAVKRFNSQFPESKAIYIDIFNGMMAPINFFNILKPFRHYNYELDPDFVIQLLFNQEATTIHKACYGGHFGSLSSEICHAPNRTMFWDSVHPSSFGHCLLAQGIHQKLFEYSLVGRPSMKDYFLKCRPELVRSSP